MSPELLDAASKLSIQVVAIIALTYVIYLLSKAVNKMADSHTVLAKSVDNNEATLARLGDLTSENIKITKELVQGLEANRCPAVPRRSRNNN